jgi:hypothetical protein
VYDRTTTSSNAPIRRLGNNSATCLAHPYNVEVRPCRNNATVTLNSPVQIRVVDLAKRSVLHQSRKQRSSPFLLFGPAAESPRALPNGRYYVGAHGAPEWGRVVFTQSCPCPKGKKGRKGCRKRS